jgi:hypothetical protein
MPRIVVTAMALSQMIPQLFERDKGVPQAIMSGSSCRSDRDKFLKLGVLS